MNISSVSNSSLASVSSLSATSATQATQDASAVRGDQSKMSKMGQLMGELQDLEKSDPAKAKQVLPSIADKLKSQAASTGDSKMADLANKFDQAAQTGDLSALQPKGGHGGGHHHRASSASAYAQNSSNPMDEVESAIGSALG